MGDDEWWRRVVYAAFGLDADEERVARAQALLERFPPPEPTAGQIAKVQAVLRLYVEERAAERGVARR